MPYDLILPILGFLIILFNLPDLKKGANLKNLTFLFIGLAIMGFSIYDKITDNERKNTDSSNINELKNKVSAIEDSLNKVGINIEDKTGKLLIIDSQLLKKKFIQIINNNTLPIPGPVSDNSYEIDKKLNKAFQDLENSDNIRREINLDYILNNFPENLSATQIRQLINAVPISSSSISEKQDKILSQLSVQKKSNEIENYFKQIISFDPMNAIAWHYLLRSDINVDISYVISVIKRSPSYGQKYQNIVQYAMEAENKNISFKLLDSREVLQFIITNNEEFYLKEAKIWLNKMIDRKASYKVYKNTYFFEKLVLN